MDSTRTSDLTDSVFGSLTVLGPAPRTPRRQKQWRCRCVCGNEVVVRHDNLRRNGNEHSCRECFERPRTLSEEEQKKAALWFPWAMRVIRSWQSRWPRWSDEIMSATHLGLVTASRDFDPARSDDFEKFCLYRIHTQIRSDLYALERERRDLLGLLGAVSQRTKPELRPGR